MENEVTSSENQGFVSEYSIQQMPDGSYAYMHQGKPCICPIQTKVMVTVETGNRHPVSGAKEYGQAPVSANCNSKCAHFDIGINAADQKAMVIHKCQPAGYLQNLDIIPAPEAEKKSPPSSLIIN